MFKKALISVSVVTLLGGLTSCSNMNKWVNEKIWPSQEERSVNGVDSMDPDIVRSGAMEPAIIEPHLSARTHTHHHHMKQHDLMPKSGQKRGIVAASTENRGHFVGEACIEVRYLSAADKSQTLGYINSNTALPKPSAHYTQLENKHVEKKKAVAKKPVRKTTKKPAAAKKVEPAAIEKVQPTMESKPITQTPAPMVAPVAPITSVPSAPVVEAPTAPSAVAPIITAPAAPAIGNTPTTTQEVIMPAPVPGVTPKQMEVPAPKDVSVPTAVPVQPQQPAIIPAVPQQSPASVPAPAIVPTPTIPSAQVVPGGESVPIPPAPGTSNTVSVGRMSTLSYQEAEVDISSANSAMLDQIVDDLKRNPNKQVRIQSYAFSKDGNVNEARRNSLQRAIKVRKYLIDKDVNASRISVNAIEDINNKLNKIEISFEEQKG